MIRRVWSDLKTFRPVELKGGMNVVLADQAKDADETESTNGLGKTTLLRIIHFCLGSDLARDKVLNHPALAGVTFGVDFTYGGAEYSASRNTAAPKRVVISKALAAGRSLDVEAVDAGFVAVDLDAWRDLLSALYFPQTLVRENDAVRYSPSFRELALYFGRIGKAAYVDPQLTFQGQSGASKRLCVSYLLGLNWGLQRKLVGELAARANVKALIKAIRTADDTAAQTIGDLEAERVALETQLRVKKEEMDNFNVREDYRDLERQLGSVDGEIHELVNANFSDTRLRDFYVQSAAEQPEADPERPVQILRSAGAVFKEEALKTLEQVAKFHADVYRNRKEFLQSEIQRLTDAIDARTAKIDELSRRKQELLGILRSSGAIDTLIALQRSYTDINSRHEVLAARIADMKKYDRRDDEIAATISNERSLLKADLEDRREAIDEARALFAQYTAELYGKPGKLGVDVGPEGYSFSFTIDRGGSDGVDQMVVFCFDLTWASLIAKRGEGFPTLLHDSSIFADVDPRQYAAALRLAAAKSAEFGFQYVCTLNSGSLPAAHFGDFKLDDFVRLTLTDEGPSGRLLGMKLPPIEKGKDA